MDPTTTQSVDKLGLNWINSSTELRLLRHRSPKLLVRIWCLYTWLRTNAVYYKTLYGNLLYPWIFFRNKTCKTILFHLLVQCLLLLLHVESWAVLSIIERVLGSGRWGEVDEGEGRRPSWFTGKTPHTFSHKIKPRPSIGTKTFRVPHTSTLRHIPESTSHDTNGHAFWFPGHATVRDWSKWHCDK